MPYRRLPKTDAARLKALKTLLSNNDIYTVRKNSVDWKLLSRAQTLYDRLLTATEQYHLMFNAQTRHSPKSERIQRNASMFVSHFLQVLFLAVERKEIKKQQLTLYGLPESTTTLPQLKTIEGLLVWAPRIIEGEKQRIKNGGKPIYNPTIGVVSTHFEIFKELYEKQQSVIKRTQKALNDLKELRPEVDELLQNVWNEIEKSFEDLPTEAKLEECRKFGIVYYYRSKEKKETQCNT